MGVRRACEEGVRSMLTWPSVSVVFTIWKIRSARFAGPLKPRGPDTGPEPVADNMTPDPGPVNTGIE